MDETLDLIADETIQVELQHETGFPNRFKLYVHREGRTIVRICKLKAEQINVPTRFYTQA